MLNVRVQFPVGCDEGTVKENAPVWLLKVVAVDDVPELNVWFTPQPLTVTLETPLGFEMVPLTAVPAAPVVGLIDTWLAPTTPPRALAPASALFCGTAAMPPGTYSLGGLAPWAAFA